MSRGQGALSKRARWHVGAGAGFLFAAGVASLLGDRQAVVGLALYGFVLHTVFGKAYSLVPSYFDRDLSWPLAPAVHLPLSVAGAAAIAFAPSLPDPLPALGSVAWAGGVTVFVGTILWTVRGNLTGGETATGEANADRRRVDRAANAFVPVALAYLLAGAYESVAVATALPAILLGYGPQASHLLAAGGATVMLFAVGFRLLPRFTVAHPPRGLVAVVLPAGALGPGLLAAGLLGGGPLLHAGATLEALAVGGFAAAVLALYWRTDRNRVGFYGVLAGALSGVAGVGLGLSFAFASRTPGLVVAHYRLNLFGFLGLAIVGVAYQFYPPSVGQFRGASDRTALASILAIATGLGVETLGWTATAVGWVPDPTTAVTAGRVLVLAGAGLYVYLLWGVFYDRYRR